MHASDVIEEALELSRVGLPATTIAKRVGVPRSTVRDWLNGNVPRARTSEPGCRVCGGAPHAFDELPPEYVYLLGLYLGDGCISEHHRGVFRLRIMLDAIYPLILHEAEAAMRLVMPASKVGRLARRGGGYENSRDGSNFEVSSYSKPGRACCPSTGRVVSTTARSFSPTGSVSWSNATRGSYCAA